MDSRRAADLVERSANDQLAPLYALVAATGLRRGEATGLRWRQVHLDRAELVVDTQRVSDGYAVREDEPKTGRGRRRIALDRATVVLLQRHRTAQLEHWAACRFRGAPEYVFTREDGRPHHPDFVSKHFAALCAQLGLPTIRLHDLRHTHATLGLTAGVRAKVMADRLGHSTIAVTLDTYSHVTPAMDAAAAALIADLVAGGSTDRRDPPVTQHPKNRADGTKEDQ